MRLQNPETIPGNLVTLIRRIDENDFEGIEHPNPERDVNELAYTTKAQSLAGKMFDLSSGMFFHFSTDTDTIIFGNSDDGGPSLEGQIQFLPVKDKMRHVEVSISYKLQDGSSQVRTDRLPRDYVKQNSLDYHEFITGVMLPTSLNISTHGYVTAVSLDDFEGDAQNLEGLDKYIVEQIRENLDRDKRGAKCRARDNNEIDEAEKKFFQLRAKFEESPEFYCTAIILRGPWYDFERNILAKGPGVFGSGRVQNKMHLKIKDFSEDALLEAKQFLDFYFSNLENAHTIK